MSQRRQKVSLSVIVIEGGERAQWANSGGEVSITLLTSITSANTPQSPHKKNYHRQSLMHYRQPLNHQHQHKNHNNDNNYPESFILELSWLLEGLKSSS